MTLMMSKKYKPQFQTFNIIINILYMYSYKKNSSLNSNKNIFKLYYNCILYILSRYYQCIDHVYIINEYNIFYNYIEYIYNLQIQFLKNNLQISIFSNLQYTFYYNFVLCIVLVIDVSNKS